MFEQCFCSSVPLHVRITVLDFVLDESSCLELKDKRSGLEALVALKRSLVETRCVLHGADRMTKVPSGRK